MTDYTELKRLAEDAMAFAGLNGEVSPAQEQFIASANPKVILALLVENERLNTECKQLILLEHHGGTVEAALNLLAERDQLKAESEALKSDIQSWRLSIEAERNVHKLSLKGVQDELDQLTGPAFAEELAALRKDAERYRYLRHAQRGYIEVVEWIGSHATGMTGEDLDALLDTAMGKGEQS